MKGRKGKKGRGENTPSPPNVVGVLAVRRYRFPSLRQPRRMARHSASDDGECGLTRLHIAHLMCGLETARDAAQRGIVICEQIVSCQ